MTYKYYKRIAGESYTEVYRVPNNGNNFQNNIPFLEKYVGKGTWSDKDKDCKALLEDDATGWFSEHSDEITEGAALEIVKTVDAKIKLIGK